MNLTPYLKKYYTNFQTYAFYINALKIKLVKISGINNTTYRKY